MRDRICRAALLLLVLALGGLPLSLLPLRADGQAAPELMPSTSVAGRFLVAAPELLDPNFTETVVLMVEHDREGAMGVVINRVIARGPLKELMEDLGLEGGSAGDAEIAVHQGGPVEPDVALFVHSSDYQIEGTRVVTDGIAITPSLQALEDLAAGNGPEESVLAVGYAGWAPGQLERELAEDAWRVVDADPSLVFSAEVGTVWKEALARHGLDL